MSGAIPPLPTLYLGVHTDKFTPLLFFFAIQNDLFKSFYVVPTLVCWDA